MRITCFNSVLYNVLNRNANRPLCLPRMNHGRMGKVRLQNDNN